MRPSSRNNSVGNSCVSSHSITCGLISASVNFRMVLRSCCCSWVYPKSIAKLDDLFRSRIPADRAAVAITLHRHAASDRDAEPNVEGTMRLSAGANGIEKILHVDL